VEAPVDAVVPVRVTGVAEDGTTLLGHVCGKAASSL
jgi:threonylcarbamoyladenosine tRNA methylthiotransferase MtaB